MRRRYPGRHRTHRGPGRVRQPRRRRSPSRLEGALFHYSAGQITAVNLGAFDYSVSHIPGTAEALSGGFQAGTGTGTGVVWQYC